MLQAIPNIIRIVFLMLLFYIVFGILAVGYFKGRFYQCQTFDPVTNSINDY